MTSPNPNPDPTPNPNPDPKPNPAITPEIQAAIDSAATIARKEGEKAGKKAAEDAAAQAKKDADAVLELERKTKAGEFDGVKATIEKDRDDWKTRAETAEAWRTKREEDDAKRIETGAKDLPADLVAFDPGKDAPLDQRLRWFETAVVEAAKRDGTTPLPGNPPSPKPAGPSKAPTVESVRDEMRRNRGLPSIGVRSS